MYTTRWCDAARRADQSAAAETCERSRSTASICRAFVKCATSGYLKASVARESDVQGCCADAGSAPTYLSRLVRVADLPERRSLLSARSNRLPIPSIRLSTDGGRAFPVTGPSVWNNLPDTVTSAPTLSTFRQRLKTYLCSLSPSLTLCWTDRPYFTDSGSRSDLYYLYHSKNFSSIG